MVGSRVLHFHESEATITMNRATTQMKYFTSQNCLSWLVKLKEVIIHNTLLTQIRHSRSDRTVVNISKHLQNLIFSWIPYNTVYTASAHNARSYIMGRITAHYRIKPRLHSNHVVTEEPIYEGRNWSGFDALATALVRQSPWSWAHTIITIFQSQCDGKLFG